MSPKLLQKKSNRFLQMHPPENLTPNKALEKRERFRSPRPSFNHFRMEMQSTERWLHFLLSREKMQQVTVKKGATKKSGDRAVFKCTKVAAMSVVTGLKGCLKEKNENSSSENSIFEKKKVKQTCFRNLKRGSRESSALGKNSETIWNNEENKLVNKKGPLPLYINIEKRGAPEITYPVAPYLVIMAFGVSRAVGGKMVDHLNESALSATKDQGGPYSIRSIDLAHSRSLHFFTALKETLSYKKARQEEKTAAENWSSSLQVVARAGSPSHNIETVGGGEQLFQVPPTAGSVKNAFYGPLLGRIKYTFREFLECRGSLGCSGVDDIFLNSLGQRIECGFFQIIYSLQEKARWATRRDRINDDYRNQLAESRKIALLYGGLKRKSLARAMHQGKKMAGNIDCNFFSLLESRLDVVLKRALFFSTIKQARQWISSGRVAVNNQPVTISSYQLQSGDLIGITGPAQERWRKESLARVGAALETVQQETATAFASHKSGQRQQTETAGRISSRFGLSPLLMQRLQEWSPLWGKTAGGGSRWSEKAQFGPGSLAPLAGSLSFLVSSHKKQLDLHSHSALGAYSAALADGVGERKMQTFFQERRETAVTNWFYHKGQPSRDFQRPFTTASSTRSSTFSTPDESNEKSTLQSRALQLQQQQCQVVDGLYALRCNKIFAKKKRNLEKRLRWRLSSIKPMHLECSYNHCSAVFLYSPQKLGWPSSINVSLLRKVLGC